MEEEVEENHSMYTIFIIKSSKYSFTLIIKQLTDSSNIFKMFLSYCNKMGEVSQERYKMNMNKMPPSLIVKVLIYI